MQNCFFPRKLKVYVFLFDMTSSVTIPYRFFKIAAKKHKDVPIYMMNIMKCELCAGNSIDFRLTKQVGCNYLSMPPLQQWFNESDLKVGHV